MIKIKDGLITLMLIIYGLQLVNAQEKLSFGLSSQIQSTRLAVNGTRITPKKVYRPTSVLFSEYNFHKKMIIHLGLGYSVVATKSELVQNDFQYLAMPLYLKHNRLKDNKKFGFTFFYGPNLRYLLKAQQASFQGEKVDNIENIRKLQWDFVLGGGLKCKLSEKLILEALPSFSVGSMVNKANPAAVVVRNINTSLMLNLSYKIK